MNSKALFGISTLAGLLLLAGCASGLSSSQRAALDRAAVELDRQLTPAGQLAATAALIYAEQGTFPTTQFGLLGSPQAAATRALHLNLSALEIERDGDALHLSYILLPTPQDPTDRMGSFVLRPTPAEGQFEAAVELLRREDPDHTGRPLFLTQEGQFGVTRLSGTFNIDLVTVREQVAVGEAGDLPLDEHAYRITFTPAPGVANGIPPDLVEGYVVTVGQ